MLNNKYDFRKSNDDLTYLEFCGFGKDRVPYTKRAVKVGVFIFLFTLTLALILMFVIY
jgi:hypothetical protein